MGKGDGVSGSPYQCTGSSVALAKERGARKDEEASGLPEAPLLHWGPVRGFAISQGGHGGYMQSSAGSTH